MAEAIKCPVFDCWSDGTKGLVTAGGIGDILACRLRRLGIVRLKRSCKSHEGPFVYEVYRDLFYFLCGLPVWDLTD